MDFLTSDVVRAAVISLIGMGAVFAVLLLVYAIIKFVCNIFSVGPSSKEKEDEPGGTL